MPFLKKFEYKSITMPKFIKNLCFYSGQELFRNENRVMLHNFYKTKCRSQPTLLNLYFIGSIACVGAKLTSVSLI